jgi:hypothetical protein
MQYTVYQNSMRHACTTKLGDHPTVEKDILPANCVHGFVKQAQSAVPGQ